MIIDNQLIAVQLRKDHTFQGIFRNLVTRSSLVNYQIIMAPFAERVESFFNRLLKKVHIRCIILCRIVLLLSETTIILSVKNLYLFPPSSGGSKNIEVRVTGNIFV